jgi:hypothetical protein
LAGAIEPIAGQVYFSPECHDAYARLGFGRSSMSLDESAISVGSVALPDGPAYFCSRGSLLGQVPGEVIAAAFAVFNPAVVLPAVSFGWTLTNASTMCAARTAGAVAQLTRIPRPSSTQLTRVRQLLERANSPLRPEGRPLYSGLLALEMPGEEVGDVWRLADQLREYRGDAHTAAWTSAGLDGVEIGLLTELYWGLPLRTYVLSRGWSTEDLDAAQRRLLERGLIADGVFTERGRMLREEIELVTDRQCRPIVDAIGDDLDELLTILQSWGEDIRAAGGYLPSGPHDLARNASG